MKQFFERPGKEIKDQRGGVNKPTQPFTHLSKNRIKYKCNGSVTVQRVGHVIRGQYSKLNVKKMHVCMNRASERSKRSEAECCRASEWNERCVRTNVASDRVAR